MKKLLSDKDASFDMTHVREGESDSKSVKGHKMYMENPRKGTKKIHGFEQEWNVLRDLVFYFSILSTFYSFLQNIYLGFYLKIQLHIPLII